MENKTSIRQIKNLGKEEPKKEDTSGNKDFDGLSGIPGNLESHVYAQVCMHAQKIPKMILCLRLWLIFWASCNRK